MAYIYKIFNDVNDKIYIGKTEYSLKNRFSAHCYDALKRSDKTEKRPLYRAMRKYGVDKFHIELIEETDNPAEREIYWINRLQTYKYGYNATLGGEGKKYIDYDLVIEKYLTTKNMA